MNPDLQIYIETLETQRTKALADLCVMEARYLTAMKEVNLLQEKIQQLEAKPKRGKKSNGPN